MKKSIGISCVGRVADSRRPAVMLSGKKRLVVAFLLIFLLFCILSVIDIPSAIAQPERDAVFTSIRVTNGIGVKDLVDGGNAKIYYGQDPVYVNITMFNGNCSMVSEKYVFRIGVTSVLTGYIPSIWDSADIRLAKGNSTEIVYDLCRLYCGSCAQGGSTPATDSIWNYGENLSQPLVFTFKLYYYNEYDYNMTAYGKPVLEEEKTITITVVNDYIDFSQEQCNVETGKTGSLEVGISNLDDGEIRDLNLTIDDPGVFEILPGIREMSDFTGFQNKTTTFNVKAPETIVTGTYNITVNVIYQDLLGRIHSESRAVAVTVEPEPQGSFPYLIVFSVAAVAVAGAGGFLFFRIKRNAQSKNRQQGKHRNSVLKYGTVQSV